MATGGGIWVAARDQANPGCPVFNELVGLVRKTIALVDPIRAALEPLSDRIELAVLYGSVVKGTDTAASDIDLLVVATNIMLEDLYSALAPVEAGLDRKVNPTLYTPEEYRRRRVDRNSFLSAVLEDDHLVLLGSESASSTAR